jgi:hypothetical protein
MRVSGRLNHDEWNCDDRSQDMVLNDWMETRVTKRKLFATASSQSLHTDWANPGFEESCRSVEDSGHTAELHVCLTKHLVPERILNFPCPNKAVDSGIFWLHLQEQKLNLYIIS